MQGLPTKDKAYLDTSDTLGFAMNLRSQSSKDKSVGKRARFILCNFVPLHYGPAPAGVIRKKYA